MEKYYYSQLNKEQKAAYHAMEEGFRAISPSITVPRLDGQELYDIFFRLRLDNPDIFYAPSFTYKYYEQASVVQLIPQYLFEKKKIIEHQKALSGRIKRLIRPVENSSQEEKEKFIHDFICENVIYDKLKKSYSHEIIGPLQTNVGVCEGIAKTVKVLCDNLGIDCIIALCKADPENGAKYRHAWNVVKINGKWYHLDATFDNSLGKYGGKRYDYFNLDDSKIFLDHRELVYPVPKCSEKDDFYYKKVKMSFTKLEDIFKRINQALRKKQEYLIFHYRGGKINRDVLIEILNEAKASAEAKEKSVQMSFNYAQQIIQLKFTDTKSVEDIVQEEAEEDDQSEA